MVHLPGLPLDPTLSRQWIFTARIRRMGKVMFSVCSHLGGYPYPIMLCNISQNATGQPAGVLCQVQAGGYPARSRQGGTLAGGTLVGGTLAGGTLLGGTQVGYPRPGQEEGGTQLGQQKENSPHGGQYASCVHAGGLSCHRCVLPKTTDEDPSNLPTTRLILEYFRFH